MAAVTDIRMAYGQLVDLARSVAAAGHFGAAYHALMSAVHLAEDAGDTTRLAAVADMLRHYKGVVDALRPPHRLSTQAAHGGRSVFEMGALTAESEMKRLDAGARLAELREGGGASPSRPPRQM